MRWPTISVLAALGALAWTEPAGADGSDDERARALYDGAVEAANRGDVAQAARLFAEADRIAPHPVALRSALEGALQADLPALGMNLAERAERRGADGEVLRLVAEARERFSPRTGQLLVRCAPTGCRASVDGAPAELGVPTWVVAGKHSVEATAGVDVVREVIEVHTLGVETVSLSPAVEGASPSSEAPAPAPPADASEGGLHPALFFVALGVTAALGGISIASAVDTKSKHDDFDHTQAAADDGEAAQLRTNLLLAGALVGAGITVSLGAFAVDWSSGSPAGPSAAADREVARGVALRGRFR